MNPPQPASDGKEIVAPVQTTKVTSSVDAKVNSPKSASKIDAPVSTTIATISEDVGQQFLITHEMRNVLEAELGYHSNEVNEMHPEVKKSNEVSKF